MSTNQRLPDRWRVKTMKRLGTSVTLHRAGGAARRAKTAFDGPAARALVARATRATSDLCARGIAASAVAQTARLSPTQTRLTQLPKKQNCQNSTPRLGSIENALRRD